jgi:hypothetical protein
MPVGIRLRLLQAIKTVEWSRYDGTDEPGYITAGTHGTPDAIDLRVADPPWNHTNAMMPIEYRHVGADEWIPTGYAGRVSYDVERGVGEDMDGFRWHPYKLTSVALITR